MKPIQETNSFRLKIASAFAVRVAVVLVLASLALAAIFAPSACNVRNQAFASSYSSSSAEFSDLAGQTVAQSASEAAANHVHVYDHANILSSNAEAELSSEITRMINDYGYDIVIFTDTTTHGCSERGVYAADFYERNHYGIGSDISGMVFFICMEQGNRGWFTAATGSCTSKVTSASVNYVDDAIESTMRNLDFDKAASMYLENWDDVFSGRVTFSANGASGSAEKSDYLVMIIVALVIGIIVGFLRMRGKKRKMKTIDVAQEASAYMVENSLELRGQSDRYVTTTVIRTPIKRDEHKGGRSDFGGFSSSGGTGFSGGGRGF